MPDYPLSDPNNPQPDAGDDSAQPIQNTPAATPTPTTPTPAPSAAQAPATATASAQQPQSAQRSSQQPSSNGTASGNVSNAPPVHPSVQKASVLRNVALALSGGPRWTTSIDPQTGATTRTQVPVSGRDIGFAIALEALSGGIAGFGQRGPGAVGAAATAGFNQVSAQQQAAAKAQEQQAQTDNQNASQALIRRANAFEVNSRTALNTSQSERYGVESLKDAVSQNAKLLSDYQDAGNVMDSHVSQDDLQSGMTSGKYHAAQNVAVPDGFTKIGDKYEQTFSVIADPSAKVPLHPDQAKAYADAGVRGFTAFKTSDLPEGVMVPGYMVANANQQVQAVNLMKADFSSVSDALAKSDDKGNQELAKSIPSVHSLLTDPTNGYGFQNALGKFQSYVSHSDQHGMDLYESLQQMAAPSKPDPQNPKQFIPNRDQASAQIIAAAYGGGDAAKGWQILKAYHKETTPAQVTNESQATAVLADPDSSSKAKLQARSFLTLSARQKAAEVGADARAKAAAKGAGSGAGSGAGNQSLIDPNPASGVNDGYLKSLPASQQQIVRAIAEGRMDAPNTRTKEGKALAEQVTSYAPDYDGTRFHSYQAMQKDFTSGKSSQGLQALNTALGHLGVIFDNATLGSTLPGVSNVERAFGNQTATNLKTAQTAVTDELGRAYKAGVVSEGERKEWEHQIDGWTSANVRSSTGSLARLLDSKIASYEQTLRNGAPSGAVRLPALMSPQAAAAYTKLTGERPTTSVGTNQNAVGVQTSQPPVAGAIAGRDSAGRIVAWKLPDGTVQRVQ